MKNISYETNRAKNSINHKFPPEVVEYRKRWGDGVYTRGKEYLKMPLELALDERLSPAEKMLGAAYYTLKNTDFSPKHFGFILKPKGVPKDTMRDYIKALKECGYIRSYHHSTGQGRNTVYEWIATDTPFLVDNEVWDKEKSAKVASKFL